MRIEPDQFRKGLTNLIHMDQPVFDVGHAPLVFRNPGTEGWKRDRIQHQAQTLVNVVILVPGNLFLRMNPAEKETAIDPGRRFDIDTLRLPVIDTQHDFFARERRTPRKNKSRQ